MRRYRHFSLWLNGVRVRTYQDDGASSQYHSGRYLDDFIRAEVAPLEEALACKMMHAEVRGRTKLFGLQGERQ